MAKRIGRVKTHMSCIVIMAIGYALVVFSGQSANMLFFSMVIIGVGWAAVVSLPFAIMSETVNQARMGLFMGLFNLSVVLPQLIASSLGRYIDGQSDKSIIYIISAIALGVSAVLWLLVREQEAGRSVAKGGGAH